jgi:murein DD-endopeptidase MepM/ murein hydrolase activator NlpD
VLDEKCHNLMKKLLLFSVFISIAAISFSFTDPPSGKSTSKVVSKLLVYPVAGNKSYIKDKWGASRAGGLRKHKGIDIHARRGTPVVAICDGVIVDRDHTLIGGKTLWLKSSRNSWTAYYAHLDRQLVKEGQVVRKGQVIGTVGNTGNARTTPSHLHFGVSQGKKWVNPLPYVKGAKKVAAPKISQKKKATYTKKINTTKRVSR